MCHAFPDDCTARRVEGRGQGDALLAALGSSLQQYGVNVNSAAAQNEDGKVLNVFKVTTTDGKKVPKVGGLLGHCILGCFSIVQSAT